MKGLFRKDLYVLRGAGIWFILMDLLFAVIPDLRFFAFAAFYTVMLTLILFQSDEQCKFDTLLPMLPVSRKQVVLETYIFGWGYMALLTALAVSGQALLWSHTGYMPLDGEYFTLLFFDVGMALAMQGLVLPILFRYGSKNGRLILTVAIFIVTALSVGVINGAFRDLLLNLSKIKSWQLIALGTLISAASVPLSIACYKRRVAK